MVLNQNLSPVSKSLRKSLSQPEENRPHRLAVRKAEGLSACGERREPDGVAVPVQLRAGPAGDCAPAFLEDCQRNLKKLYDNLPGKKRLAFETVRDWERQMETEEVPPRSVNSCLSALNNLFEYLGRRDFRTHDFAEEQKVLQPELTWAEYLRLLRAVRALEKERVYFFKVPGGKELRI